MDLKECKLYRIVEVAAILGYTRGQIYKMIEDNRLKALKGGNKRGWRISGWELINYTKGLK
jgi:excisionase family DNA binding protein